MTDTAPPAARARALPLAELRRALLGWYDRSRRELPWRAPPGVTSDPWAVLVSELMLQQTTAATVSSRFGPFLARFPTLAALAAAPLEDVLHAWQGLGYYRRARALHALARVVVEQHEGRLPRTAADLARLPGVGPYTAAAVAAIAGGEAVVPVDGNVERVLSRVLAVERPLPAARPALREAAQALAATDRAGDLAQALMELGALVCTPRRPACLACPLVRWCRAAARGDPESLPRKLPRPERARRHATAFLLERGDGAVLFRRRPLEGLLGGMIELPSTPWLEGEADAASAVPTAAPMTADWASVPGTVRHVFSHIELSVRLVRAGVAEMPAGLWVRPAAFGDLALPTLTRRLLRHAGLRW